MYIIFYFYNYFCFFYSLDLFRRKQLEEITIRQSKSNLKMGQGSTFNPPPYESKPQWELNIVNIGNNQNPSQRTGDYTRK